MIGIDLFCGAGGMTLGAKQAGIKVKYAVECDKYSAMTYSHNNPEVKLINDDIRKVKELPIKKNKEQLIVFGGPPCQGFSTSNQKTRTKKNPENWLYSEFIRVIKMLMPDWVIFENVKGFMTTQNGLFYDKTLADLNKLGYTTSPHVLDAVDFGVPQKRQRVFIIASLHGIKINISTNGISRVTVKDAIHDLPILRNGAMVNRMPYKSDADSFYSRKLRGKLKQTTNNLISYNNKTVIERYKYIPQGGNWKNIPASLMKNYANKLNCHSGIYHRLKENEPSIVIGNFRKNMLIHPTQTRGLSVREAARLQSFPDWFVFQGNLGSQQQQVGNAVPPSLSRVVFKSVIKK
ncbi:MAG: DNA cytosine methyltransferase [Ignavibacteria bacterium]|jgi:DNA (cytosine-5)-methyltransferase 1